MPVPSTATFSVAALVAAHDEFKTLVDAGTGAGSIKIRSAADLLLAQVPLTSPCGTVNGSTGRLTITANGRDESADATGTAAYAEICDGDGLVHLAIPAAQGVAPVSGVIVLNTLSIIAGGPVEVLSVTIG
jgi:hypothetical protein